MKTSIEMLDFFEILKKEFINIAAISNVKIGESLIEIDCKPAPHKQPKLGYKKMAVYVFMYKNKCLKVGKVGLKSKPRFRNQHYLPKSCKSNLARSLLLDSQFREKYGLTEEGIKEWMLANLDRVDFLIDESIGVFALSLLEAFLQCKLNPIFEGYENQKKF